MDNEQQILDFIETVYRRQHLRREFGRIFDAMDDIGENLDLDGKRSFLVNMRRYLGKLALELEETEQEVAEVLPTALAFRETLTAISEPPPAAKEEISEPPSSPRMYEEAYRDTWDAPPDASPADKERISADRALDSWDAPKPSSDQQDDIDRNWKTDDRDGNEDEEDGNEDDSHTRSPPFDAPSRLDGPDAENDGINLHQDVISMLSGDESELAIPATMRNTDIGLAKMPHQLAENAEENDDVPISEDEL